MFYSDDGPCGPFLPISADALNSAIQQAIADFNDMLEGEKRRIAEGYAFQKNASRNGNMLINIREIQFFNTPMVWKARTCGDGTFVPEMRYYAQINVQYSDIGWSAIMGIRDDHVAETWMN